MEESQIAKWYSGQNILITGATGFMGKVLLEKILRSCPLVERVFILIRPKRGKEGQKRLEEFLKSPAFDTLRQEPHSQIIFNKIKCIKGDVTKKNCDINDEDFKLLQRTVTMVFHMAANVRFDQTLKTAVLDNVGGTQNILELVTNFQKLKMFMYVATSFSHCYVDVLEEKTYNSPQDPRKMLDLVQWMDEPYLEVITPALLKDFPNTYAYTKNLTEQLVVEYSQKLPIVIVRPSIVLAAYKDPIPGWVDNIQGPTGIIVGAGKGIIRTMHCNTEFVADIIPVDMAINAMLIIAWKSCISQRKNEPEVYHITSNPKNVVSWGKALELGRKHFFDYPFSICLWYPGGSAKSNYFVHSVSAFLFHTIPAYLIDFLLGFTSHKPFMVTTQKRIHNGLKILQYYTTKQWKFRNEKLYQICETMTEEDNKIFYTNKNMIDFDKYMLNYILGARKYCMKEDLDTLPQARKLLKRLYYLDVIKNICLLALLLWLTYLFFTMFVEI